MNANTGRLRRALPLGVLLAAGVCFGQAWSKPGWKYRRPVTIAKFKPSRLDGFDVGVVDMPTGGLIKPDGSDIRVVKFGGAEADHRVLMVGPGDRVRIAFAVFGGMTGYSVYFGNPSARPPTKRLDIKRGVLLETWQYRGGGYNTLVQVKRVFQRANKLLGRDFRDTIFLGHNPFGPQFSTASLFTGWLIAPRTGTYTFACSSRNASFLLVDDQVIVSNGGTHAPYRDIRKRGTMRLTAGLHKLTFYHVNASPRHEPVAVAAWQAPGEGRVWTIPKTAFAPIHRATPGPMRESGQVLTVDFLPEHAGEAFMMNRYFQRYRFKAVWSGQGGTRVRWKWDFGDGQADVSPAAEHVYLTPGPYTVTLTGTLAGRELKRTNRIYVSRPWDRVTQHKVDSIRYHANIVAGYDFTKLSPQATAWAVKLFQRTGKAAAILQAGAAFVRRADAPAASIRDVVPAYADELAATGKGMRAVGALQKAAQMTKDPGVCAEVLVKAGQVLLLDSTKAETALSLFQAVIKRYSALTRSQAIREARMGIGDVWRVKGDYEKAADAYQKAHTGQAAIGTKAPIVKGDFARHVEDYIRRRDYESAVDYLRRWEQTFPLDKLEGYWSLLRVQLLLARQKYPPAIQEAEVLVNVNPTSQYAPELLMAAAEAHRKLRNVKKYKETLQRVVEKYPESTLSVEAAKLLKGG